MFDFASKYSTTEPFGNAEAQTSLPPTERDGFRFARMCHMYGGLGGNPVHFNSSDFNADALEFGKKALCDFGYDVVISPAPRRRSGLQDSVARMSKREGANPAL